VQQDYNQFSTICSCRGCIEHEVLFASYRPLVALEMAGAGGGEDTSLRKPKQSRRVVDEDALARGRIGRPFTELVVEPDGTDLVVKRQVRVVATPNELVGHGLDECAGERGHVGKARRQREAVDAGELDVTALRAVVDELEEPLKARLFDAVLRG